MEILERKRVGVGAHWLVEACRCGEPYYANGERYDRIAVKTIKRGDISQNLEVHRRVLESGLPTLRFLNRERICDTEVLVTEDLNCDQRKYVSPNTARAIAANSGDFLSKWEAHYLSHPLSCIENFDALLQTVESDMETASHNALGMCPDAFFFGIDHPKSASLDYKIADFDSIILARRPTYSSTLVAGNTIEMMTALWEFLDHFVEPNDFAKQSKVTLERKVHSLRN